MKLGLEKVAKEKPSRVSQAIDIGLTGVLGGALAGGARGLYKIDDFIEGFGKAMDEAKIHKTTNLTQMMNETENMVGEGFKKGLFKAKVPQFALAGGLLGAIGAKLMYDRMNK